MSNLSCEPVAAGLEKFVLYQTTSHLYIVGCDKRQSSYRVLKVLRREVGPNTTLGDVCTEDFCAYAAARSSSRPYGDLRDGCFSARVEE